MVCDERFLLRNARFTLRVTVRARRDDHPVRRAAAISAARKRVRPACSRRSA
jgi:hypothetical protein